MDTTEPGSHLAFANIDGDDEDCDEDDALMMATMMIVMNRERVDARLRWIDIAGDENDDNDDDDGDDDEYGGDDDDDAYDDDDYADDDDVADGCCCR